MAHADPISFVTSFFKNLLTQQNLQIPFEHLEQIAINCGEIRKHNQEAVLLESLNKIIFELNETKSTGSVLPLQKVDNILKITLYKNNLSKYEPIEFANYDYETGLPNIQYIIRKTIQEVPKSNTACGGTQLSLPKRTDDDIMREKNINGQPKSLPQNKTLPQPFFMIPYSAFGKKQI